MWIEQIKEKNLRENIRIEYNKKGLLRRQTHLLWLLHLKRMANEYINMYYYLL